MTLYLDGKLHDTTPGIPFSRVPCRLESNLTPSTSAQEGPPEVYLEGRNSGPML